MAYGGQEIAKFDPKDRTTDSQPEPIIVSDPARGFFTQIHNAGNVQMNGKMTVYMNSDGYKKKNVKPKKPVTELPEQVTLDQRLNIKDRIGRDWKDLGRRLKFDDAVLEQMKEEHRDNLCELNYQILLRWERENPRQATQANLAKIFIAMRRGDLSDLLAE